MTILTRSIFKSNNQVCLLEVMATNMSIYKGSGQVSIIDKVGTIVLVNAWRASS